MMAALGGMILPAAIYVAFNAGVGGEAIRGWGIPMATDIAFALGVVALLGSKVPSGAKLFLLALASVPGSVLPQRGNNPLRVDQWLEDNCEDFAQ